jgi:hypothetical protein
MSADPRRFAVKQRRGTTSISSRSAEEWNVLPIHQELDMNRTYSARVSLGSPDIQFGHNVI